MKISLIALLIDFIVFVVFYIFINLIINTSIYNKIYSRIKGRFYVKQSITKEAKHVKIHKNAIIKNCDRICFGDNVNISNGAELFPLGADCPKT